MTLWLANLAIDRWRGRLAPNEWHEADATPLALIGETAHGPRIEAVNAAGLGAGAEAGMMLADARALCPQIATAPADPAGDLAFLETFALWAPRGHCPRCRGCLGAGAFRHMFRAGTGDPASG